MPKPLSPPRITPSSAPLCDIQAYRRAQERAEQLLSISTALGAAVTTAQVADVIIQAALPIFQATVGLLALLSGDGRTLRCEQIVGVPASESELWRSFPLEARLPLADAVRERRLVALTTPESHDDAYPDLTDVRPRAADGAIVAVPLLVGDRRIGGIGLICPPEQCSGAEQQTFLWTLAGQCALALEKAKLYDAERRAHDEARAEVAERRHAEEALCQSEARLRLALDAGGLGTWHWNLSTGEVDWPRATKALFGLPPEEVTKPERLLSLIPPEDRETMTAALRAAIVGGPDFDVEYRVRWADGSVHWIASRGRVQRDEGGVAVSMEGVVFDITERKAAEEETRWRAARERLLADLAERTRGSTDPDEVIADAVRLVGQFLGVSRCAFADIDIEADTCTIRSDFCADPSVESLAGVFPISSFGPFLTAEFQAGRAVAVDDVQADPVRVPPANRAAYEAAAIRAYVVAPVVHSARLVSNIACHSAVPRRWNAEEVGLIEAVVERTWLTVEVLRQQRSLVREAEALREAHGRTTRILESITDAFLSLDGQWRFTYVNDQADRIMSLGREQVIGRSFWDLFPHLIGSVFHQQYHRAMAQQVPVSFETFYATLSAWLEVRAYPSPDGLSVFFRDISERKSLEQERAEIAEREHRIATQLQQALLPTIPPNVPGLRLAHYYRAALQEAGIGGDFAQVFSSAGGLSHLIVGDLAGKGLEAASQIATITHMARYAVFRGRTLAGAVTSLNTVLTEQGLLTGFATFFIGRFDAETRTLTYVNAGQDAGLVLRAATGAVERMPTTGPVLGMTCGVRYTEETVPLEAGDVLAFFTDGLTEAGPSRSEMLTGEGVADLLQGLTGVTDPEVVVDRLMAGVGAHAGQGLRDDQCLLVGVVSSGAVTAGSPAGGTWTG